MTTSQHMASSSNTRRQQPVFFSYGDYSRLLNVAAQSNHWYWVYGVKCGWNTGLRLREVATLKWSSVDWEKETLTVIIPSRFENKLLEIPIQHELCETLQWLRDRPPLGFAGSAFVQPQMAGNFALDQHRTLSSQFTRLCRAAKVQGFFGTFRQTFIRNLLKAAVDPHTIACLTGISDFRKIGRYADVSLDAKRAALHSATLFRLGFNVPHRF